MNGTTWIAATAEVRARILRELGEDYTPTTQQIERWQEFGDAVRSDWGDGRALKCLVPSVRSIRQLGMLERMCASPGMARATVEASFGIDVRPILPTITIPTLIVHARGDPGVPVQDGRYLADHISGAQMLEVEGVDHAPWFTDSDRTTARIEEFLTGSHAAPPRSRRALRTVLFTDMVASTQHAAAAGDERWRAVLQRFDEITSELTQRFEGTVVKSTGDGHLATFDGPTQAIRCAEALRADAETLGIRIRSAIHTGECELLDADIGGIAVHVAARILGQAGAGEILVSRTVRDLVIGSGTGFDDRGSVELRGVPGTWQLLAVDRRGARAGTAEAALASMPTPGPRTAMRRSDRAVEVMARRTPWILRGVARLAPARRPQLSRDALSRNAVYALTPCGIATVTTSSRMPDGPRSRKLKCPSRNRCHSTVRAIRNTSAPISGLVRRVRRVIRRHLPFAPIPLRRSLAIRHHSRAGSGR